MKSEHKLDENGFRLINLDFCAEVPTVLRAIEIMKLRVIRFSLRRDIEIFDQLNKVLGERLAESGARIG